MWLKFIEYIIYTYRRCRWYIYIRDPMSHITRGVQNVSQLDYQYKTMSYCQ